MRKKITILKTMLLATVLFVGSGGAMGQLLQWNTYGNLGTETTEPSVFNDANISASNLTQGTITAAGNGNRFGGYGWFNTGNTAAGNTISEAITGNDYIQFIVTPNSGYSFTPTSFVFSWENSPTGPKMISLRSSADNYAADLGTVTSIAAMGISNTITITGLVGLTTATTFRVYAYGSTASNGTGGFDIGTNVVNVALNGTASLTTPAVPTITVTEVTVPTMSTSANTATTETINVSGANLTGSIGLAITGTNAGLFSVSQNSITQTGGTAANTVVTITYSPTAQGSHSAILTISSTGAVDITRTLNGTASAATGIDNISNTLSVSAINGKIILNAAAGVRVSIYNAIGQQLLSKLAVDGLNTISVSAHGVVIVKVGNRVAKVIM